MEIEPKNTIQDNNNNSMYFLLFQFMQKENMPSQLIDSFTDYVYKNNKVSQTIDLEGNKVPVTLQEQNNQLEKFGLSANKILNNMESFINNMTNLEKNDDKLNEEKLKNLALKIKQRFTTYLKNLDDENQPNQRHLVLKKKHKFEKRESQINFNKMNFIHFKQLKYMMVHAYSQSSGIINSENEEPFIPINALTYDKSGRFLFSGDQEGLIKVFSSQTGMLINSLIGHSKAINVLDVSPCNKYLASCSQDATARIWDFVEGKPVAVFKGDNEDPLGTTSWGFFNNILFFITCSDKGMVYIYKEENFKDNEGHLDRNQEVIQFKMPWIPKYINGKLVNQDKNEIYDLCFHPKGYVTISLESGEIFIYDKIQNFKNKHNFNHKSQKHIVLEEHQDYCNRVCWHPSGEYLLSASNDGTCKVWIFNNKGLDYNEGMRSHFEIKLFQEQYDKKSDKQHKPSFYQTMCTAISWTTKGDYAVAAFHKHPKKQEQTVIVSFLYVYSLKQNKIIHIFDYDNTPLDFKDFIWIIEAHPIKEEIIITADYQGQIALWDIKEGVALNMFQEKGYAMKWPNLELPILDARFHPNGEQFVVCSFFGTISIYGLGNKDFFKITPVEQFFTTDNEPFGVQEDLRITSLENQDIEIHQMERGSLCNQERTAYTFDFKNDIINLKNNKYFENQAYQQQIYRKLDYTQKKILMQDEKKFYKQFQIEIQSYNTKEQVFENDFKHMKLQQKANLLQVEEFIKKKCTTVLSKYGIKFSFKDNKLLKATSEQLHIQRHQISIQNDENDQNNNDQQPGQNRGRGRGRGRLRRVGAGRGRPSLDYVQQYDDEQLQIERQNQAYQEELEAQRLQRIIQEQQEMQHRLSNRRQMHQLQQTEESRSRRQNSNNERSNRSNRRRLIVDDDDEEDEYEADFINDNDYDEDEEEEEEKTNKELEKNIYQELSYNSDESEEIDDEDISDEDYGKDRKNNRSSRSRGDDNSAHKRRKHRKEKRKKRLQKQSKKNLSDESDIYGNEDSEQEQQRNSRHNKKKVNYKDMDDTINSDEIEQSEEEIKKLQSKSIKKGRKRIVDDDDEDEEEQIQVTKTSSRRQQQQEEQEQQQQQQESRSSKRRPLKKIDSDEDSEQEIPQSKSRKKVKINDDYNSNEEQSSKRKKQEQNSLCHRCNEEGACYNCDKCNMQYHKQTCYKVRGVTNQNNKFVCFNCLSKQQLKKKNDYDYQNCIRDHLETDIIDQPQYLPQIEDQVYFILPAYEQFVVNNFDSFDFSLLKKFAQKQQYISQDKWDLIFPQENFDDLNFPTLCKVKEIQYQFPVIQRKNFDKFPKTHIFQLLTLEIVETKQQFQVYFSQPDYSTNFLIIKKIFDQTVENLDQLKQGAKLSMTENKHYYDIQIVSVQVREITVFPESEYLKYKIKIINNEQNQENQKQQRRTRRGKDQNLEDSNELVVSAWDIRDFNVMDYMQEPFEDDEIVEINKIIDKVKEIREEEYEIFGTKVDIKAYPDYIEAVEVPIDLKLIQNRLTNGFYRSKEQLFFDIDNVKDNCFKFNEESDLTDQATEICKIFRLIINNFKNIDKVFSQFFASQSDYKKYIQQNKNQNLKKPIKQKSQITNFEDGQNQIDEEYNSNSQQQRSNRRSNSKQNSTILRQNLNQNTSQSCKTQSKSLNDIQQLLEQKLDNIQNSQPPQDEDIFNTLPSQTNMNNNNNQQQYYQNNNSLQQQYYQNNSIYQNNINENSNNNNIVNNYGNTDNNNSNTFQSDNSNGVPVNSFEKLFLDKNNFTPEKINQNQNYNINMQNQQQINFNQQQNQNQIYEDQDQEEDHVMKYNSYRNQKERKNKNKYN